MCVWSVHFVYFSVNETRGIIFRHFNSQIIFARAKKTTGTVESIYSWSEMCLNVPRPCPDFRGPDCVHVVKKKRI